MKDPYQLREIFQRYVNNECSQQEIKFLFEHFKTDDHESILKEIISEKLTEYPVEDLRKLSQMPFDEAFNNILAKIDDIDNKEDIRPITKRPMFFKTLAVVAIVLIIFQVFYFYFKPKTANRALTKSEFKTGILPGSNKAILTLGDGSKIILNDAKNGTLAKQGNANVVKLTNGQLAYDKTGILTSKVLNNTMTTPRGGQYKLTLPDGTDVWLNAASSITYPTSFTGKERTVSISGEVYFEVAKDKNKPFYVKSGDQTIEVLGTHFNVMAYKDEDEIKTTLFEGSVRISENNSESIIKPGEQARVTKNGGIEISTANVDDALAWKNGYFKFNRVDIKFIMRQLARWYDVDILYEGRIPDDEFVGKIDRSANISQVLRILELDHVHFRIEGKKIIVMP